MRHNSNIDFIQPSGGNVLETHHIEFETIAEEPTLPSGGLWFTPNDDELRAGETRVEAFKYQAVSGIREVRIDEGYGSYQRTSTLEMGTEPENYFVNFSGLVDSKFYNQFGEDFTIKVSGLYRVAYNFIIRNSSSGGNNDGVNQMRCLRNGVTILQSETRYHQGSSSFSEQDSSAHNSFLVTLDVDDILNFEFDVIDGGGNSYDWFGLPDNVNIEFIRRGEQ